MSQHTWALFLHLLGVIVLGGGMTVAAVALWTASRRGRPSEVALLLGGARAGVMLVGLGSVLVLVGGLWLIQVTDAGLNDGWLGGSLALFVLALLLGALGGQRPKQARLLAERLARDGDDQPSPELHASLRDRLSLALNAAAALAILAVLLLMIWQPG